MNRWMWLQLALFQLLWLIAVIGQNDWLIVACILLLLHFTLSPGPHKDITVLPIALIGIGVDIVLMMSGLFEFEAFPYWLLLLWAGFVLSLNHSLYWLKKIPNKLLIPLGAIMGTTTYIAGWKLNAVVFPYGLLTTAVILLVIWSILLPLLLQLDTRLRRLT